MKTNRRGFLKALGLGAGATALAVTAPPKEVAAKPPPQQAPRPIAKPWAGVVARMNELPDGTRITTMEVDGVTFQTHYTNAKGDHYILNNFTGKTS